MPQKAAAGGGGIYLGTPGWVTLGEQNAVVVIFKRHQMEDFKPPGSKLEPAVQIATDVLIVAPASRAGEFWPAQNVINGAITSKLIDIPDGTAIGARMVNGKNGANTYPMANVPSDPEYALVEAAYTGRGISLDAPDADEQLRTILTKEHTEQQRENARAAAGTPTSRPSSGSAPVDDDDAPPF
jgi:hypothetical protein